MARDPEEDSVTPLAAVPPMGWNSWDAFGTSVTEAEVRAAAEFMAERMADSGWEYVVVDIQWYEPNARPGGYNSGTKLCLDEYGLPSRRPTASRRPPTGPGSGRWPNTSTRWG
ncbi:hypothetical protein GCM10029992_17380 [Glycomyces albus]